MPLFTTALGLYGPAMYCGATGSKLQVIQDPRPKGPLHMKWWCLCLVPGAWCRVQCCAEPLLRAAQCPVLHQTPPVALSCSEPSEPGLRLAFS
jgi:hypothetical protein